MKKWIKKVFAFLYEAGCYLRWWILYIRHPRCKPVSTLGENVVVVGNGPSAKDFPYAKAKEKGYKLCCVNYFALSEDKFRAIRPEYYCCVDPEFSEEEYQKIERGRELFRILESVDWDMTFICPGIRPISFKNPHIRVCYENACTYRDRSDADCRFNRLRGKLFDRNKAIVGMQNVTIAATFFFVMGRANRILLTGVESDWHRELIVGEDNQLYREHIHFYGVEMENVTATGLVAKGEFYQYIYFYYLTLREFAALSKYAQDRQVPVINTCIKSYIDVFPKEDIFQVLGE